MAVSTRFCHTLSRYVLLCLLALNSLHAAKILMFPGPFSHFGVMSKLAHALHQKGHKITFIAFNATWTKEMPHYDLWLFNTTTLPQGNFEQSMESFFKDSLMGKSQFDSEKMAERAEIANVLFKDFLVATKAYLREKAEKEQFDLAYADAMVQYSFFLIKSLELPLIVFNCGAFDPSQHARLAHTPSPLSYIPVGFTPVQMTDNMTFLDRLSNVGLYFATLFAIRYYFDTLNVYAYEYLPEVKGHGFEDIMSEAELWMANTDFTLEFPRPLTPNVVYVGGMTAVQPQPLVADLERFVSGSGDDGIIVFSLGTTIKDMDPVTIQVFVDVFSELKQRVVWRYAGAKPPSVPDNVRTMSVIPQNDLLGHPKARVFLNHGGISGVMESIFHGVPVVGIPIFGDQFDVMTRVVTRGYGLKIDITNVTRENILGALKRVLNDDSFARAVKKSQAILRSHPQHPLDRAVYWVEHVIQHGGKHLRPASHNLSTCQYFLVDVIAFIAVIVAVVLWILKKLVCCVVGCCKKKSVKTKKE